jgi:hypothetical protein
MDGETTVVTAQILGILLLIAGLPAYAMLKLKWRAEAAEKRARSAGLKNARLEAQLEEVEATITERDRVRLRELRQSAGPLDTPPPGLLPVLEWVYENAPVDPYFFAFGWERVGGVAAMPGISLHGDSPVKSNHGLVTGENDSGKGVFLFSVLAQLTTHCSLDQLRVVWIDPKRDGSLLKGMAHLWVAPCLEPREISDALLLLRMERVRRMQLREQHQVLRWEELPEATRPPMLWVYVGELDLLALSLSEARNITIEKAEDALDAWLTTELVSARAEGIRYAVDVQDAANRKMRWRKQIGWFAAGYTSTWKGVEPALNATPEEVKQAGGQLPTSFKAPGYFTVRVRADYATVRTPLITLHERKRVIASLPSVKLHVTATERLTRLRAAVEGRAAPGEAPASARSYALDADERAAPHLIHRGNDIASLGTSALREAGEAGTILVSAQERQAIVQAIENGLPSRRQVCIKVYGSSGGKGFKKVKQVCDELGLLVDGRLEPLEA